MPKGTPSIKVRNVARLGAKVVLHGDDFDAAKAECARLAQVYGLVFVPPYDDPLVIAGQGTVGMEILKQVRSSETLDGIFASIGGGGLVAGILEYVKRIGSPKTNVIGVETVDGDAMDRSLKAGERVTLQEVGPFSDGTAVKIVGEEPFRICKNLLDDTVLVNNDEICAAIKDIFEGKNIRIYFDRQQLICSRDAVGHRAGWCLGTSRSQTLCTGAWSCRCSKAVCGRHQWGEYELWTSSFRRGTCGAR